MKIAARDYIIVEQSNVGKERTARGRFRRFVVGWFSLLRCL